MSTFSPQIDQADRELLVAYLDGELGSEDAAVVESRLASDAAFRRELQQMQRAWDALSDLPRPTATEDFTKTTLDMVTVAAANDVQAATVALPVRRRRYVLSFSLVTVIAAVGGILLGNVAWPDPNDTLLENLPVIMHVDAYRFAGNLEFLQQLHEELGQQLALVSPLDDASANNVWQQWRKISHDAPSRRLEYVTQLESTTAGELYAQWKRFEGMLSPPEKQQLAALHEQLLHREDSQELVKTLVRFDALLARRSAGDRAELHEKSSNNERLALIRDWLGNERPRLDLSPADKQAVIRWFRENWPRPVRGERRRIPEQGSQERQELVESLMNELSEEGRQALQSLRNDSESRSLLFRLPSAIMPSFERMDDDLLEFFQSDQLSNDERARLLLLPDREMQRELMRLYLGPLMEGWREWGRGGRPGGRGGRGRGEGPPGRGPNGGEGRRPEGPQGRDVSPPARAEPQGE